MNSGLILTRRPGETVRIGRDITVTVLGIKGNQARIHFSVPREIVVDREEIHERKRKQAAAKAGLINGNVVEEPEEAHA